MAAPSGGIPKHSRILGILEIFMRTSPLDFQALASRFAALKSVNLTESLKRALYRDLQELVAENRLEEVRTDGSGDRVETSPDLDKMVAKSLWRLSVPKGERFWGENLLLESGIEITGSDFLVSEVYAQMDMELKGGKFVYFAFGEHERLRVRIPKDLIPFTVYIGRSKSMMATASTSRKINETQIVDIGGLPKAHREIVIALPDASISRKHCAIAFDKWNSVVLSDLKSSNGTSAHFVPNESIVNSSSQDSGFRPSSGWGLNDESPEEDFKAPTMSLAAYLGKLSVTHKSPLGIESKVYITCGVCRFLLVP